MRFQVALNLFLLAFMLTKVNSQQFPVPEKYCAECAEEVWEEIPCDEIEKTTLPPIITPSTILTTPRPITLPPITPSVTPPIIPTSTMASTTATPPCKNPCNSPKPTPITTTRKPPRRYPITPTRKPMPPTTPSPESSDAYKNCYCECKSGCKEFCRKIVVHPDAEKQITQLSKTLQPLKYGQLEVKHLLERNWIPTSKVYNSNSLPKILPPQPPIQPPQPPVLPPEPPIVYPQPPILPPQPPVLPPEPPIVYPQPPILPPQPPILPPQPPILPPQKPVLSPVYVETNAPNYRNAPNYQPNIDIDSFGFSIEELTKLLNSEQSYANMIPELSQPPRQYQNLYASPLLPANNPHLYSSPQREISNLDANTSATVGGTAVAVAASRSDYKTSVARNYNEDQNPKPCSDAIKPVLPEPAQKYENSIPSYNKNNLPHVDAGLDGYFRDFLYPQAPKTQGHGYSLSF